MWYLSLPVSFGASLAPLPTLVDTSASFPDRFPAAGITRAHYRSCVTRPRPCWLGRGGCDALCVCVRTTACSRCVVRGRAPSRLSTSQARPGPAVEGGPMCLFVVYRGIYALHASTYAWRVYGVGLVPSLPLVQTMIHVRLVSTALILTRTLSSYYSSMEVQYRCLSRSS